MRQIHPVRRRSSALRACTVGGVLASVLACSAAPGRGPAQKSPTPSSVREGFRVETVATGLVNPWGLAFLPDGRMLVTERPGRLRIVGMDGNVSPPLTGVPAVFAQGQGGLLDVALDPAFATNKLVYLSFAEPGDGGAGTSVARARLGANGLAERKPRSGRRGTATCRARRSIRRRASCGASNTARAAAMSSIIPNRERTTVGR